MPPVRFTMTFTGWVQGVKLMAGSCVKAFKQDLDDIKRAAEASAAQPA